MDKIQALKDAKETILSIQQKSYKKWIYQDKAFSNFKPGYSFSNENLSYYYPMFNLKNKDVLTVCGSGDQVLSACDANSIDSFDSNTLAYYNMMLKIYASKSLTFDEFCCLYSLKNKLPDRKKYYEKIKKYIKKEDIMIFWNEIFNCDNDLFTDCFLDKNIDFKNTKKRIPYLNKIKYEYLKNIIDENKITFKNIDILKLTEIIKKYDFINLSNIMDYIPDKDLFIDFILKLNNNLNENGKILVNYSWSEIGTCKCHNYVADKLNAKQIEIKNTCLNDSVSKGSIIVYKKR